MLGTMQVEGTDLCGHVRFTIAVITSFSLSHVLIYTISIYPYAYSQRPCAIQPIRVYGHLPTVEARVDICAELELEEIQPRRACHLLRFGKMHIRPSARPENRYELYGSALIAR